MARATVELLLPLVDRLVLADFLAPLDEVLELVRFRLAVLVDLRWVAFRAVDFRAVDFRAVDFRAGDFRAVDFRVPDFFLAAMARWLLVSVYP